MNKKIPKLVYIICVVAFLAVCFVRLILPAITKTTKTIDVSSILIESKDIAELSTAEFKYRGIADAYEDEEKTRLRCRICYSATVKASFNIEDLMKNLDTDENKKTITVTMPNIFYKVKIDDEYQMITLPNSAKIDLPEMLQCCKEDAEYEASQSNDLRTAATENLKASIEGLLYPITRALSYELIWK